MDNDGTYQPVEPHAATLGMIHVTAVRHGLLHFAGSVFVFQTAISAETYSSVHGLLLQR